jgi:hypothetical protein
MTKTDTNDWFGKYKKGWKGIITPEAFSHPAKYARALIRKIYDHCLQEGWLQPGDTVLDPFGGVALGGLDAMRLGLNWVGCELEPRFQRMGNGYDCPGLTKQGWLRWSHRLEHNKDLCPDCWKGLELGYVQNSGIIPSRPAHHYTGNIDLWNARYAGKLPRWGSAVLLNGDSRQLAQAIGGVDGSISSPPYADISQSGGTKGLIEHGAGLTRGGRAFDEYGSTPGQLGAMKAGNLDAAISSPPFSQPGSQPPAMRAHAPVRSKWTEEPDRPDNYGSTPGNLGNMKASISSPPYLTETEGQGLNVNKPATFRGVLKDGQLSMGTTPGNLAGMDAAVSSPPYQTGGHHEHQMDAHNTNGRGQPGHSGGYADESQGQLQGSGDNFWSAARAIVDQVYNLLKPGARSVWVLKAFVKDKAIVDFPGQWQAMCEAAGFQTIHVHKAWLVEDRGVQYDLMGNSTHKKTERKSFFRRNNENKAKAAVYWDEIDRDAQAYFLRQAHAQKWDAFYNATRKVKPPKSGLIRKHAQMLAWKAAGKPDRAIDISIDYEIVLCMVKP